MQLHYDRVRRRYWPRTLGLPGYLILIVVLTLLFLVGLRVGLAQSAPNIQLLWEYTQGTSLADGFLVDRCVGAGCTNFTPLTATPLPITTLTYTDSAIQAGTTYRWQVRAKGPTGVSAPSAAVQFSVPQTPPVAPVNLRAIFTP